MKGMSVIDALDERKARVLLVHTEQHYQSAMSDRVFAELGIHRQDHFLGERVRVSTHP